MATQGPRRELHQDSLAGLLAVLLLAGCVGQPVFRTDNLNPGTAVSPRPGQSLIFGSLKALDEAGHTRFPSDAIFPPLPSLRLYGLSATGSRTLSLQGLAIHSDGTFAAWLPAGDYALFATWPDAEGDLDLMEIAVIRLPADGGVYYTGELVLETRSTGVFWKNLPSAFEVTHVTSTLGAAEVTQAKVERRSGTLPGPARELLWCTEGVPPGIDPGNARNLARLDEGCGSTVTAPRAP